MTKPIKLGESLAQQLLPVIAHAEQMSATDDKEKVQFWAGFVGVVVGSMAASVGPEATEVVNTAIKDIVADIVRSKSH